MESATDLKSVLREHDLEDGVRLTVLRGGAKRFAFLELS